MCDHIVRGAAPAKASAAPPVPPAGAGKKKKKKKKKPTALCDLTAWTVSAQAMEMRAQGVFEVDPPALAAAAADGGGGEGRGRARDACRVAEGFHLFDGGKGQSFEIEKQGAKRSFALDKKELQELDCEVMFGPVSVEQDSGGGAGEEGAYESLMLPPLGEGTAWVGVPECLAYPKKVTEARMAG